MLLDLDRAFEIDICKVSVSYGDKIVLKDISMHIPQGKLVVITGRSGIGKTTILDCLARIIYPESGYIKVNNVNINKIPSDIYRKKVGYLSQDTFLFNSSIRSNIVWNYEKYTEEEFLYACKISGVSEFVEKLEYRYETIVGDKGICLSGGQRQRIGIARAILGNKKLLLLDEATSALDKANEREFLNSILSLRKNLTIIFVTHNQSIVEQSDLIFNFDNEGAFAQVP